MSVYQEIRLYSVTHGGNITRLSMADPQGQESFATLPHTLRGKAFRAAKAAALDAIFDAIDTRRGPGEVVCQLS